jgi:hypothetical protein
VNNGWEYIIDILITCVKNKLFGSVKKPHELKHQPNILGMQIFFISKLVNIRDVHRAVRKFPRSGLRLFKNALPNVLVECISLLFRIRMLRG